MKEQKRCPLKTVHKKPCGFSHTRGTARTTKYKR